MPCGIVKDPCCGSGVKPTSPIRVGFCGEFQVGKSLLLNSLLGGYVSLVGDLFPTTPFPITYQWAERPSAALLHDDGSTACKFPSVELFVDFLRRAHCTEEGKTHLRKHREAKVTLANPKLRQIALVDMPGFNAHETDDRKATEGLERLDFGIFVATNSRALNEIEIKALRQIAVVGLPCVMVINCYCKSEGGPSPHSAANKKLARENGDHARNYGINPIRLAEEDVILVNAAMYALADNTKSSAVNEQEKERNEELRQHFENGMPLPGQLRKESQVNKLSRFILAEPERCLGWNAGCLGILHREIREWQCAGKQLIKTLNQGS